MNINLSNQDIQELVNGLAADAAQWKGFLAIVLKSQGGSIVVKRNESMVNSEFEIVFRRVDEEGTVDSTELEFKLLEGKEEIESVLGKPSPIIVPS